MSSEEAWERFIGEHKQSGFVERAWRAGYDAAESELAERLRRARIELEKALAREHTGEDGITVPLVGTDCPDHWPCKSAHALLAELDGLQA